MPAPPPPSAAPAAQYHHQQVRPIPRVGRVHHQLSSQDAQIHAYQVNMFLFLVCFKSTLQ
jgi:hypothetical protein